MAVMLKGKLSTLTGDTKLTRASGCGARGCHKVWITDKLGWEGMLNGWSNHDISFTAVTVALILPLWFTVVSNNSIASLCPQPDNYISSQKVLLSASREKCYCSLATEKLKLESCMNAFSTPTGFRWILNYVQHSPLSPSDMCWHEKSSATPSLPLLHLCPSCLIYPPAPCQSQALVIWGVSVRADLWQGCGEEQLLYSTECWGWDRGQN